MESSYKFQKIINSCVSGQSCSKLFLPSNTYENNSPTSPSNTNQFVTQAGSYLESKASKSQTYDRKRRSKKVGETKAINSKNNTRKKNTNPKRNKRNRPRVEYVHQSLVEHLYPKALVEQAKSSVLSLNPTADVSKILEVLEVVGALAISLPMCKTPSQVASQILLSVRAMTNGSVTEAVLRQVATVEWCKDTFGFNLFDQQAGDPEPSATWLNSLPSLKENWDATINAPIFTKISNLISVAASIGLCSVTNLKWSVGGVDLFRAGTIKKHQTASDLVGAVLDTIIMFIEGGFECFRQGSFKPLFFSSDEGRKLDALYFPLVEAHEHAMVFNLHAKKLMIKGEKRTISDIEYSQLLDEAIDLAQRAYKTAKGTWQQGYLEKRLEILHKNRAAYQAKRIDGSMRFAPFTIYIWGASGVGKSTVAQIMMADCLAAAGVNPDTKGTAVIKESDKYDSTLKGDTVGVFFDDMGNTKTEFLDKSPTERVVDINNNMITYANKADLHEKGKTEIRPRVFIITSNVPLAFHGRKGSVDSDSITRRADLHMDVSVKDPYALPDGRLNSTAVLDAFPGDSLVNDVWDLDLYVFDGANGNSNSLSPLQGGTECTPVSIFQAIRICTTMCVKHFKNQEQIVRRGESLVASRNYCPNCNLASDICECCELDDDDDDVPELETVTEEMEKQASYEETFESISAQFTAMGDRTSTYLSTIPSFCFDNRVVRNVYLLCFAREFIQFERTTRYGCLMSLFVNLLAFHCFSFSVCALVPIILLCFHAMFYMCLLAKWRDAKFTSLAARRDLTIDMFASLRQSKMFQFFSFCVIAKVVYQFVNFFRGAAAIQQSALAPKDIAEVEKRDAEINPWATAVASELHVSDRAATMTHDQVVAKVKANLYHAVFTENDFQQSCDALALGGNVFLMPLHVFKNRKDMKALFTRAEPTLLNSTFKAFVSTAHMLPVPGKDACLVSISSGGVHADILHLFPDLITASGSATFLYRNQDGSMREADICLGYVKDSESGGAGFKYSLPFDTFTGLCMGTVVAKYARNCIAGVHLRGIPNSPEGKALTLTRKELEDTRKLAFKKWKGAFPSHVNGTFPETRYEQQICTTQEIHPKSPVNYLPVGSSVTYLGQAGYRSSMTKSRVRITPISEAVTEVTGVSNIHSHPKFHRTLMWQASLAHSANPSPGIEGSLVVMSYDDYIYDIKLTFNEFGPKWVRKELTPLTEMQTLCGIDGKRFIDAIPKGTSPGFLLSGTKGEMMILLDPKDYPDFQCPAEMHPMVSAEIVRMEEALLRGERCYSIFKACVKDQATLITKTTVRVFQAADWATQMIVRKYYLPIVRLLSIFPIASEVAVGVNSQGPEWDILAKHMRKFGSNRILAGDYSKYDLRMPAQLVNAAFSVLLDLAESCGNYTKRDLIIMRGIATEIAYSCVAYNGDLIIHNGSNPSGHNLTVYINCIVNSLQLRCAYFHLWPKNKGPPPPFRTACAVMTYGDDVKGSVKEEYDWFNHISYAQFMKERDMVFTMPDKESKPTAYMNDCDADFLKRQNIFNPDTGLIHGALAETSIFKALHTVLESKVVSIEDQSAKNIDGALREWWQHGRSVYETRRSQMKRVATRCGLELKCEMLSATYEDRLDYFNNKYIETDDDDEGPVAEDELVSTVGEEYIMQTDLGSL